MSASVIFNDMYHKKVTCSKKDSIFVFTRKKEFLMTGIILTVIGVLLLDSFVRFRIRHSVDLKFVEFMEQKCQQSPNEWRPLLGLASAYANAELYAKARSLYMDIKNDPSLMAQLAPGTLESIETNIKFCEKPLPWSKGAKDHHSFRYLHHFFLKRIGGQRYSFITEEDVLGFTSRART